MSVKKTWAASVARYASRATTDYYPTPPWATRALIHECMQPGVLSGATVWEPCAGGGHMTRPLESAGADVLWSDVSPAVEGMPQHDFLMPYLPAGWPGGKLDWVITNPPFTLAEKMVLRGLEVARNVAVLVRLQFLEGSGRGERLFDEWPPAEVWLFRERVTMVKGRLAQPTEKIAGLAAYCWMIWCEGFVGDPRLHWIPPCRKRFDLSSDYDEDSAP